MADPLDKFIREIRKTLDDAEPAAGHMERFENRLRANRPSSGGFWQSPFIRFAAVLAVGFMLGYLYYVNDPGGLNRAAGEQGVSQASLDVNAISPELAEAEAFFSRMLREKMETVASMEENDSIMVAQITAQLKGLEKDYNDLRQELAKNQTSEDVINAMIQNYRLRLDLIEHVLDFKNQGETLKKTYDHEDIES